MGNGGLPRRKSRSNLLSNLSHHSQLSDSHLSNLSQHSAASSRGRHRSLHEGLVVERDQKEKFEEIYEVLEEMGRGGLCHVYKIRKRDEMVGGSSRPEIVRRSRRQKQTSLVNLAKQFSAAASASSNRRSLSSPSLNALFAEATAATSGHAQTPTAEEIFRFRPDTTPRQPSYSSSHKAPLLYALKVFNLKLVSGGRDKLDQLHNEVELLRSLDHPSIIKVYETFQRPDTKELMLVMELCTGGDLYTRLPYIEHQVAVVMKQVLSAVTYLHDRKVVHRDIKLENILFESQHPQAAIKLIDFGLSATYTKAQSVLKERVGTLYSMAPETMKGSYTAQADLWSIGVVAFTMLSGGQQPFEGKTPKQVVAAVLQGQYSFHPTDVWDGISDDAKAFVKSLLMVEPADRSSAQQAIRHPFIGQSHQFPKEFFKEGADEELKQRIRDGIVRYGQRSDFQRLALNVIAKKSSTEEIFEIRKVFDEFDQENTGTITLDEFRHALAKFKYSEEDMLELFQKVDISQTSVINYTEFLACTLEAQGKIEEHRLAEAFDLLDTDNSGFISRDDLKRVLGENTDVAYIDQLIAQVEPKKDGRISYEEFLRVFAEEAHDRVYDIYEESTDGKASSTQSLDEVLRLSGIALPGAKRKRWNPRNRLRSLSNFGRS